MFQSRSRCGVIATLVLAAAGANVSSAAQIDSEPPIDPIARFDCPPVVVGSFSVVNASNPTETRAELRVRVFGKAGKVLISRRITLEPGASESVEVRFPRRLNIRGRLLRAQVDQIDGALGILATFQELHDGIGGLTAGTNVVCTTPNRPF